MAYIARVRASSMALLVLIGLILIQLITTGASADKLYPKCTGRELSARALGNTQKLLGTAKGGREASSLMVECLAFEVTPVSSKDECPVGHNEDYPISLAIRARSSNGQYSDTFGLQDLLGGSVGNVAISVPEPSEFEILFINQHPNSNCMLQVRAIVTTSLGYQRQTSFTPPTIVEVDPPTMYAATPATLVLQHSTAASVAALNDIFLVPIKLSCFVATDHYKTFLSRVTDTGALSPYLGGYGSAAERFSVWRYENPISDNFRICGSTKVDNKDSSSNLALLSVFGGNPTSFTVTKSGNKDGHIYVQDPVEVRFDGYSLDTRPDHDVAKLVDEESTCATGPPAGGVPQGVDLGPTDKWGPSTSYSTWTFTIKKPGGYKLCYRRYGQSWIEVPAAIDLPTPQQQSEDDDAADTIPQPTFPRTGDECPLANRGAPSPPYKSWLVRIVLRSEHVPSYFRTLMGEAICVPLSALVYDRLTSMRDIDGEQHAVVYLDVDCAALDANCDNMERKRFLLELFNNTAGGRSTGGTSAGGASIYPPKQVEALEQLSIRELNPISASGIMLTEEGGMFGGGGPRLSVVLVIAVTLVVVVGIGVYGVLQYRKEQHHFIQFGVDDDDEGNDEVEIVGAPPSSASSGRAARSGGGGEGDAFAMGDVSSSKEHKASASPARAPFGSVGNVEAAGISNGNDDEVIEQ